MQFVKRHMLVVGMGHVDRARSEQQRRSPPRQQGDVSGIWEDRRFEARIEDPLRQWKLSPMDLPSREKWYEYSEARDRMLDATDTKHAPWHLVRSDDKKRARLNCISHLLKQIPYERLPVPKVKLAKRSKKHAYDDIKTLKGRRFIPEKY